MDFEKYKGIIKGRLTEKRYRHSLCVADEAERLAQKYGADAQKAYLAGLLHDITKNNTAEEQLKMFSEFGIIADDITKGSQKLWHAVTGAAYIEKVLGITDREIISAIRYHTTARVNMSLLEKILYLADFTSADRDYEDIDIMRDKVEIGIREAMVYALSYTINELVAYEAKIHPDTFAAYNEAAKGGR